MNAGEMIKDNCPYCYTSSVGFTIEYIRTWGEWRGEGDYASYEDALAICGFCNRTVLAEFEDGEMVRIIPSPPEPPMYLPDNVENYFRQGVNNLSGNYDAAGSMFRKALETGLKQKFPDDKNRTFKPLKKRIEEAAKQGNLAPDLAEWADKIRDGGNDAVHEEEPFLEEEAQDLRYFTELVLLYLFTLPEKLELARGQQWLRDRRKPKPDPTDPTTTR